MGHECPAAQTTRSASQHWEWHAKYGKGGAFLRCGICATACQTTVCQTTACQATACQTTACQATAFQATACQTTACQTTAFQAIPPTCVSDPCGWQGSNP